MTINVYLATLARVRGNVWVLQNYFFKSSEEQFLVLQNIWGELRMFFRTLERVLLQASLLNVRGQKIYMAITPSKIKIP